MVKYSPALGSLSPLPGWPRLEEDWGARRDRVSREHTGWWGQGLGQRGTRDSEGKEVGTRQRTGSVGGGLELLGPVGIGCGGAEVGVAAHAVSSSQRQLRPRLPLPRDHHPKVSVPTPWHGSARVWCPSLPAHLPPLARLRGFLRAFKALGTISRGKNPDSAPPTAAAVWSPALAAP